jgi:hypothetical protein
VLRLCGFAQRHLLLLASSGVVSRQAPQQPPPLLPQRAPKLLKLNRVKGRECGLVIAAPSLWRQRVEGGPT